MEKFAQDIILKPVVTEESMMGTAMKEYTFIRSRALTRLTSADIFAATAASRATSLREKRLWLLLPRIPKRSSSLTVCFN